MTSRQTGKGERWVDALADLARQRGDADTVWQRAVDITRQLNVAPWIGLAVAERLIRLSDAAQLDRASRCQALQAGVLEKRKSIEDLRSSFPYAPYFLAADLADAMGDASWTARDAVAIADALLALEKQTDAEAKPVPVRRRPLEEYLAAARRMRELIRQTGCDAAMAADVEQGKSDAAFVKAYMRQKHWFENPKRRDGMGPEDMAAAPREARPVSRRFDPRQSGRAPSHA